MCKGSLHRWKPRLRRTVVQNGATMMEIRDKIPSMCLPITTTTPTTPCLAKGLGNCREWYYEELVANVPFPGYENDLEMT